MVEHKVLFLTERSPVHQEDALNFAPAGARVTMLRRPKEQVLFREIADAEFLVSEHAGEVDAEMMAPAPDLRLIQRLGSLTYDIDLGAAQRAGVMVCYWPLLSCVMVAEHMMMQMLALAKHLPEASADCPASRCDWGRPSRRTDENVFAYNWSGRTNVGAAAGPDDWDFGLWRDRGGIGAAAAWLCATRGAI